MEYIFYLEQTHKELTQGYLDRFRFESLFQDRQYGAFCYLMGATQKNEFLSFCSPDGIFVQKILEHDTPYSSTQWNLLQLALHLFNDRYGRETTIEMLLGNLGAEYRKVVYTGLEIRYGLDRMLLPGWIE